MITCANVLTNNADHREAPVTSKPLRLASVAAPRMERDIPGLIFDYDLIVNYKEIPQQQNPTVLAALASHVSCDFGLGISVGWV